MKRVISLILLCLAFNQVYASTEASEFVAEQYAAASGNEQVHIVVKKEHTMEYQQPVGGEMIPAITYGYGDMKVKGCRKLKITYLCLLNKDFKPLWSYIIPSD